MRFSFFLFFSFFGYLSERLKVLFKCCMGDQVGMAILPRPTPLNPSLPASPHAGFPHLAKVVGQGWDKILALAPRDKARMNLDFLAPSRPVSSHRSPSSPRSALLRVIIVNFLYPKILLFKQIYRYYLILFYPMWFSAFILLCVIL